MLSSELGESSKTLDSVRGEEVKNMMDEIDMDDNNATFLTKNLVILPETTIVWLRMLLNVLIYIILFS